MTQEPIENPSKLRNSGLITDHLTADNLANASSLKERVEFTDGARGIAIFWVLLFHCLTFTNTPINWKNPFFTSAGVNLFLVLSGFCLYYPIIKNRSKPEPTLMEFAKKRFRRIYPPYLAALSLSALFAFVFQLRGYQWPDGPDEIAQVIPAFVWHLFLVQGLSPENIFSLNGPFWSLSLEATFYVAFPLLVVLVRKTNIALCLTIVSIITLSWRIYVYSHFEHSLETHVLTKFFAARWLEFALGMLAAYLFSIRPNFLKWQISFIAATSLFVLANYLRFKTDEFNPFSDSLYGLSGFFLLSAAFDKNSTNFVRKFLSWKPLVHLGIMSYSVYLIHQPILRFSLMAIELKFGDIKLRYLVAIAILIILPLIFILSTLFFNLIEKPFLSSSKPKPSAT